MKTSRYLILSLAAALMLGGLTQTHAADPTRRAGAFQSRLLERIRAKLELTDDQVAQIKAILKSDKETLTSLATEMHTARVSLRSAIRSADANETTVRAASAQVATVEANFAVERMKLFARINPILTAQQRAKLAQTEQRLDDLADTAIERASDRLAE